MRILGTETSSGIHSRTKYSKRLECDAKTYLTKPYYFMSKSRISIQNYNAETLPLKFGAILSI